MSKKNNHKSMNDLLSHLFKNHIKIKVNFDVNEDMKPLLVSFAVVGGIIILAGVITAILVMSGHGVLS